MKLDANRHYLSMTKQDILASASQEKVKFITLWFTDITGIVKNAILPASELENVIDNGLHFDGSSLEGSTRVAESDMVLVPDLRTFTVIPWTSGEERTARLICSVFNAHGESFIGDPRNVLIRALKEAEEMGYIFKTGMELEFYLFPTDPQGRPILTTPQDHAGYFDNPDEASQRIRRKLLTALQDLGIRVDSTHSEIGLGQHEVGFQYNQALVSADHVLTSRVAIKTIAQMNSLYATFMPRPSADRPGSGMHTHQSLHDIQTGANLFVDPENEYGLSDIARHFLAGQLQHARAMCAVLAPLINSYKRLGTSFEAPVHITWAHINRGALIRVPSTKPGKESHTRLELRCPDPAANPYLAATVMLLAGLDGIRHKIPLPEPLEETLLTVHRSRMRGVGVLPASLSEALEALKMDDVIMTSLGPVIAERYIAAREQELDHYNRQITQWELDYYLPRY